MGLRIDETTFRTGDVSVFGGLSQSTENDRRSLLRVQALVRGLRPGYRYVEIGSFLGGTLLPHLIDPACAGAVSIDPRPQEAYPDARGMAWADAFIYAGVTTATMLEFLAQQAGPEHLAKLTTHDCDAAGLPAGALTPFDLALIDGEHTNEAVFSDAMHLLPALRPDGILAFHDVDLVRGGIKAAMAELDRLGIPHRLFELPDVVGVLALRGAVAPATAAFA